MIMKCDCYFDECKDCVWKEHNDDSIGCLTNRLGLAWYRLLLEMPIISKFIDKDKYKFCHMFEKE